MNLVCLLITNVIVNKPTKETKMIKKLFGVYDAIMRNTWMKIINFNRLQTHDDKRDTVIQTVAVGVMCLAGWAFWTAVYVITVRDGIDWINVAYCIVSYVTCQVATWMSIRLSNKTVWFRQ